MDHSWFGISAVLVCISWSSAKQILLYETPNDQHWLWNTKSNYVPSVSSWFYQSSLSSFRLCSLVVTSRQPNNWLLSTVIDIQRIQRVDIAITYTIHPPCSVKPFVTFCNDSFDVYVWESDVEVTAYKIPNPITSNNSYRKLATISGPTSTTLKTLTIPLQTKRRYIVLGFRDQVGCEVLYSVKVTYNVCPDVTFPDRLVHLQQTVAPSTASESVPVKGKCTADSSHLQGSLNVSCESSGQWNTTQFKGKCVCNEDFEKLGSTCSVCSQGTYNDGKGLNCTVIPSHPRNITVPFVNQSSAAISWLLPVISGDDQIFYEVECQRTCEIYNKLKDCSKETCDENTGLVFTTKSSVTSVTIPGTALSPFVNYTCKIKAKNRVSEIASRKDKIEAYSTSISFKTNESVPDTPEVFVHQAADGATVVSWELKCKNGIIQKYKVTYFNVDETSAEEIFTTINTEQRIEKLVPGKTYEFQVAAVNSFGAGPSGKKRFKIPSGLLADGSRGGLSPQGKKIIAGVTGGSSVLLLNLVVIIIVILRIKRAERREEREVILNMPIREQGSTFSHSIGELNIDFVEERNVECLTARAQYMEISEIHSFELERNNIKFKRLLGSGNFGEVYKATMGNDTVAVKSLKESATAKDKQDMVTELNVMKSLKPHPHVLKLIGCCSLSEPLLIVLEYLPYGDLLGYLRKSRGYSDNYNTGEKKPTSKLTAQDLLSFAWMIANGMQYLSNMKVVHRDLAARNILVGENKVCKISDFGLARDVNDDIYVRTSQARLPVKWMPPESLFRGESSTMSDVWSYGIVLWEVFTIGDSPYPGFKARQMASLLERGYRMNRPIHISEELFSIMSECWFEKPEERPTFQWICKAIERLRKDNKSYVNLDVYNDKDYVNFDMAD